MPRDARQSRVKLALLLLVLLEEAVGEMRRTGKARVIIVTSPQHTRWVRALWSRLAGRDLHAIVRGVREDPFNADRWWSNTRDVLSVVRELLGLPNVWAGLPIPPQLSPTGGSVSP